MNSIGRASDDDSVSGSVSASDVPNRIRLFYDYYRIVIESAKNDKAKYRNNKFDINYITIEHGMRRRLYWLTLWCENLNGSVDACKLAIITNKNRTTRRSQNKMNQNPARAHQASNVCAKNINLMRTKHVSFAISISSVASDGKKASSNMYSQATLAKKRNKKEESKKLVSRSALDFPHSWCGPDDKVKYAQRREKTLLLLLWKVMGHVRHIPNEPKQKKREKKKSNWNDESKK